MSGPADPALPRIGLWLAMPEPLVVEAAGRAGADWVGLDLQHGAWDMATAFRAIQLLDALGVPALVRLSELELHLLPRVLDHGAAGVVIAMASSATMMTEAVRRARYQPEGQRSYGGQRYGMRHEPEDVAEVRPGVYAMIEDKRGVEAVAQIAGVPGITGLHVGPVDLGLGLGVGRDRESAVFKAALRSIVDAGAATGVPVTMHAVRPQDAAEWGAAGFAEVVLTADIELLRRAFLDGVAISRGGVGSAEPSIGI